MTGGEPEATGTPRPDEATGQPDPRPSGDLEDSVAAPVRETRFAHASEAEMARILDFEAHELWGSASQGGAVYVDLWDDYLELA